MKIIQSIFGVSLVLVPLFLGLMFLFRTRESYDDKYNYSKFKFFGISAFKYRLFYRMIGLFFIVLATFAYWNNYLKEDNLDIDESREFWKQLEEKSDKKGGALSMAVLFAIAIPARMGSSRFPGKPLAMLGGKPVIQHVYEKCKQSALADSIAILTDSLEISQAAESIGAKCIMTSPKCASGTERIIEASGELDADFVVNVQGDEPFISPELIDSLFEVRKGANVDLVTAVSRIEDAQQLINPNVVKVLRDGAGKAIYFSRTALPYVRGQSNIQKWFEASPYWRHIGIYGYSAKALARYDNLPVSVMEKCEMLEQLRFVNAGFKFDIVETKYESIGIDTPDDLAAAEEYLKKIGG